MPESKTMKQAVQEVKLTLGDGIVDVDLKKEHINYCLDFAMKVYRQRASNATAETGTIFKYKKFTQQYDLSDTDIVDIKEIKRNTIGSSAATDYTQDPFLMMYMNQMMHALNQNMTYGSIATVHIQHNYIIHCARFRDRTRLICRDLQMANNRPTREIHQSGHV